MKLAFSTNAFRNYSLVETIGILADIGYQGVEVMADTPHAYPPEISAGEIEDVVGVLREKNIAVSNINAFMLHAIGDTWRPSWIERDRARRQQRIDHTLNCIDLAVAVGAKSLSTEPGGPLDGMPVSEGIELFRQGLLEIADRARHRQIKILIEPEPDLLIESSSQFLDFFNDLDPEVFGLNFDVGHFYCVGEDPLTLVESLNQYTCHFHIEDIAASRKHHHLMPGHGAIDLDGVVRAIDHTGYKGFVTVELYPYEDKPIDAAQQAFDYLAPLFFKS